MAQPHSAETTTSGRPHSRELFQARRLAALVILGIVIYVVLDIIAQLLPPHYSPISQAESDLAVGPYGFLMRINFVIRGLLSLAAIAALHKTLLPAAHSRLGALLLEVWAVGALVLAIFSTDVGSAHTLHGLIHLVVALIAFVAGAVGELLISLRLARDPAWSSVRPALLVVSVAALVLLIVLLLATGPAVRGAAEGVFGLVERVFIGLVLLWMLIVAVRVIRLPAAAS